MTDAPAADDFQTEKLFRKAGTSSAAAAGAAEQARLNETHRRIWQALRTEPRTPDELVGVILGQNGKPICLNSIRARLTELKDAGWAQPTGETRKTSAGRGADVMRALTKDNSRVAERR